MGTCMRMSREFFEELVAKSEECDGIEFTDSYSGRCMFGSRCFGFVGHISAIGRFYNILRDIMSNEDIPESVKEEAEYIFTLTDKNEFLQDDMGLESIFYFPRISVESSVEEMVTDED